MYIGGLGEGRSSCFLLFSLATSPPKGSHIYIYIHTLCLFFLLPFPWGSSWLSGHSLATFGNLPSGRGYVHRRARRGGRLGKKKKNCFFPLGHLSPNGSFIYIYIYTHYVCFSSFLFPGDLHGSLDILWQPLETCHQGEAMYIGGLGEGRSSFFFLIFSLATSPPKGSH